MNNCELINQSSGDTEYYTPAYILDAVREVLGEIDLDPASCEEANEYVRAKKFFTKDDNGLGFEWFGKVFMNHPFSRCGNLKWPKKLVDEFESGRVLEACSITFASTSEEWFQCLMRYPQCFVCPRTHYRRPNGKYANAVTKGSVVTYFGKNLIGFVKAFSKFGIIKVPIETVITAGGEDDGGSLASSESGNNNNAVELVEK